MWQTFLLICACWMNVSRNIWEEIVDEVIQHSPSRLRHAGCTVKPRTVLTTPRRTNRPTTNVNCQNEASNTWGRHLAQTKPVIIAVLLPLWRRRSHSRLLPRQQRVVTKLMLHREKQFVPEEPERHCHYLRLTWLIDNNEVMRCMALKSRIDSFSF